MEFCSLLVGRSFDFSRFCEYYQHFKYSSNSKEIQVIKQYQFYYINIDICIIIKIPRKSCCDRFVTLDRSVQIGTSRGLFNDSSSWCVALCLLCDACVVSVES